MGVNLRGISLKGTRASGVVPVSSAMILEFDTTLSTSLPPKTIGLPFTGNTDVIVDWGDGTPVEPIISAGFYFHEYDVDGVYIVAIDGLLEQFGRVYGRSEPHVLTALTSVSSWGNLGLTSLGLAFAYTANLTNVPNTLPSTVTQLNAMFVDASVFNQDISGWNTSAIANMSNMFVNAIMFNQPIGGWNTSSVSEMQQMFNNASAFNQDISEWDTSYVVNMDFMFASAAAFNQDLSNWCVSIIPISPVDFDIDAVSWILPRPIWGTCP